MIRYIIITGVCSSLILSFLFLSSFQISFQQQEVIFGSTGEEDYEIQNNSEEDYEIHSTDEDWEIFRVY